MNKETKEYLTRLISGVREQVDKDTVEVEGEKCIPATWLDAAILCDVIEKEIL